MNSIAASNGNAMRGGTLREALLTIGIQEPPPHPIPPSTFVRWGKKDRYWMIAIEDGFCFGDMVTDTKSYWWPQGSKPPVIRFNNSALEKARTKQAYKQQQIACFLMDEWPLQAQPNPQHRYLQSKGIPPLEIRQNGNELLVPLRDAQGQMWSLQKIAEDGSKRLLKGGRKKGCFSVIGNLKGGDTILFSEGYATAVSVHLATGIPTIMTVDAGNMLHVVGTIRALRPELSLIIAADNDQWGATNIGITKAIEAASAYNCRVIAPHFPDTVIADLRARGKTLPTDWNDLHQLLGMDELRRQLSPHLELQGLSC